MTQLQSKANLRPNLNILNKLKEQMGKIHTVRVSTASIHTVRVSTSAIPCLGNTAVVKFGTVHVVLLEVMSRDLLVFQKQVESSVRGHLEMPSLLLRSQLHLENLEFRHPNPTKPPPPSLNDAVMSS